MLSDAGRNAFNAAKIDGPVRLRISMGHDGGNDDDVIVEPEATKEAEEATTQEIVEASTQEETDSG